MFASFWGFSRPNQFKEQNVKLKPLGIKGWRGRILNDQEVLDLMRAKEVAVYGSPQCGSLNNVLILIDKLADELDRAEMECADLYAMFGIPKQQQVKSLSWFEDQIREYIRRADHIIEVHTPIGPMINEVLQRLAIAETLEAALEVNGPGQTLYEEIQACRKRLFAKREAYVQGGLNNK
jgi:hypothetical protein